MERFYLSLKVSTPDTLDHDDNNDNSDNSDHDYNNSDSP